MIAWCFQALSGECFIAFTAAAALVWPEMQSEASDDTGSGDLFKEEIKDEEIQVRVAL